MPLDLVTIPCRTDNYAFLIHDAASGETALVDAPEAGPILDALAARGWTLDRILITHHHSDHVDGVAGIVAATGARVIGAAADAHRLPRLDHAVHPADRLTICGEVCDVIDVSGHTIGHLAFHFPASALLFTADSLMAMGCGRLFEGTAAMMHDSLQRLVHLPPETRVCSGHEYTAANARFAQTLEPDNPALISRVKAITAARLSGQATVPSRLSEELATNPFLRAHLPEMKAALGMDTAADVAAFAEIRARKDNF